MWRSGCASLDGLDWMIWMIWMIWTGLSGLRHSCIWTDSIPALDWIWIWIWSLRSARLRRFLPEVFGDVFDDSARSPPQRVFWDVFCVFCESARSSSMASSRCEASRCEVSMSPGMFLRCLRGLDLEGCNVEVRVRGLRCDLRCESAIRVCDLRCEVGDLFASLLSSRCLQ